jgi:hypothetical protein
MPESVQQSWSFAQLQWARFKPTTRFTGGQANVVGPVNPPFGPVNPPFGPVTSGTGAVIYMC